MSRSENFADYCEYINTTALWSRELLMKYDRLSTRRYGTEWSYPPLVYRRRVVERLWRLQHPTSAYPRHAVR